MVWSETASQFVTDLVLGGAIGGAAKTAAAPVERVKLLLQTMNSNPAIVRGGVPPYQGFVDCGRRTVRDQGLRSLWRGNSANVLRYAPQQGSTLAFNEALISAMPVVDAKTDFWRSFAIKTVCGGVSGTLANTVCYPLDYARTLMASDTGHGASPSHKSVFHCITSTVRERGVLAMYAGWSATVFGTFIYRAGQLGFFKQLQDLNPYREDRSALGIASAMAAGILARALIVPFTYPFDTVRRRMMLDVANPPERRLHVSATDCVRHVLRHEGVRGFYRGFAAEVVRGTGVSLGIAAFDRIKFLWSL